GGAAGGARGRRAAARGGAPPGGPPGRGAARQSSGEGERRVNLAELLTIPASMYPERGIFRFEGQGTTYDAPAEGVAQVAGALATLGVQAGDRVAVLETNTPAVVEALYATASLGAVYVPLNYRARPEELAPMLAVAAPRLLLVGERYIAVAAEA